jgi:FtsP/CotA-like multicopper oxidase with cupredoxin domain
VTLPDRAADGKATITLDATRTGDMPWTINGKADPMDPLFTWTQGATVEITIVNKVAAERDLRHAGRERAADGADESLSDVAEAS